TDRNAISTGCGMAFLSWLINQGQGLDKIAPAMVALGDGGTLAQLYANLTGDAAANAFPNFLAAVQALPNGVTSDDPFGTPSAQAQLAQLSPGTLAMAAEILAVILADLNARKSAAQIVADVTKILGKSAAPGRSNGRAVSCSRNSHRLRPPAQR